MLKKLVALSIPVALLFGQSASTLAQINGDYTATPPIASREGGDVDVMLTLSMDHQLFIEVYNDYDDINGDGIADTTYKNTINYVGYFNSSKCYSYASERFEPSSATNDENYCDAGWSGNFLNWLSMTRMDLVRHSLYGGLRSIDTADATVLERAFLPQDTHSFAKYYDGNDISMLTDALPENCTSNAGEKYCDGYTFCNTSLPYENVNGSDAEQHSQHPDYILGSPPLIRVVKGNYALWASNERFQCVTMDEIPAIDYGVDLTNSSSKIVQLDLVGYFLSEGVNGNHDPSKSGLWARPFPPRSNEVTDLIARVLVCDAQESILKQSEGGSVEYVNRCLEYADGSLKPYGMLQDPELANVNFGLLTGSYNRNKDFGALRKHVSSFAASEVNADGTFKSPTINNLYSGSPAAPLAESIVGALNSLRLIDYRFVKAKNREAAAAENGTYNYGDDGAYTTGNGCKWAKTEFANGKCRNWGNPFGELLADSYRYFAGATAPSNLSGDGKEAAGVQTELTKEATLLKGLSVASWSDNPNAGEAAQEACSSHNVLAFNASGVSYDDSLGSKSVADIGLGDASAQTVDQLLGTIGSEELAENIKYFVGTTNNAGTVLGDGQCSAKTLTNLSFARGICPETPRLEGAYYGAGLAYYAHTQDLKPSTSNKVTVSTFGVTMAGALPNITVDNLVIIPLCRNRGPYATPEDRGNCALVEFRNVPSTGGDSLKFYVGWEDSEQGGDFDLDLSGTIELSFNVDKTLAYIDTQILYESSNDRMDFGFSLSGAGTADDVYFPSKVKPDDGNETETVGVRIWDYINARAGLINNNDSTEAQRNQAIQDIKNYTPVEANTESEDCTSRCDSLEGNPGVQRVTVSVSNLEGATAGRYLKDPLYYAVKWGAFEDGGELNGIPDDESEWAGSERDAFGDYLPFGYAHIKAPQSLSNRLYDIVRSLVKHANTGTGSGVATNTLTGEGLAMQTFYAPQTGPNAGPNVSWTGLVSGLLRDKYGNLREDSNGNGKLDDPTSLGGTGDKVVRFFFDANSTVKRTRARLYDVKAIVNDSSSASAESSSSEASDEELETVIAEFEPKAPFEIDLDSETIVDLNGLKYLWDANAELNAITANAGGTQYQENRSFSESAAKGRYIYTAIDGEGEGDSTADGAITAEDLVSFEAASVAKIMPLLDVPATDKEGYSTGLINFIRGEEGITVGEQSFRSRTLDGEVYRLGDVIHSAPVVIGRPTEGFGSLRGDISYEAFINKYRYRRQVAYVGGNDGMLHAFNVGYFNSQTIAYYDDVSVGEGSVTYSNTGSGPSTLGQERWAYVPHNLLPHLKWLANPDYAHVYFMDGPVQSFDVNIFNEDTDHPGGWGTIIVAGMRFGGGDYTLNAGEETEQTLRSAYVILDVTNPEKPPVLLGEISHEDLGYTLSNTAVIVRRSPNALVKRNDWHLVFGSGPQGADGLTKATSDVNAHLFYLDLNKLAGGVVDLTALDTGIANSFVGGVTVKDWNGDYFDDGVYFGLVGDGTTSKGQLMYANIDATGSPLFASAIKTLLKSSGSAVDLPFSAIPVAVTDREGNHWLYAHSGRYYVESDLDGSAQNYLYGVNVKAGAVEVTGGNLLDVSEYHTLLAADGTNLVRTNIGTAGTPSWEAPVVNGITINNMEGLTDYIVGSTKGWMRQYEAVTEIGYLKPVFKNDTIYSATFSPSQANSCEPGGSSYVYSLDMFTGMPQIRRSGLFINDTTTIEGKSYDDVSPRGNAIPGQVVALVETANSVEAIMNDGTREPLSSGIGWPLPARESWREVPLDSLQVP